MTVLQGVCKSLKKLFQPHYLRYYSSQALSPCAETEDPTGNQPKVQEKQRIVWIDMEMTGLEIEKDRILEVACLITDDNLNVISSPFNMVLHQPDDVLNNMIEWCQNQHAKTGLIEESRNSKFDEKVVEEKLLYFMMHYVPKGKCALAGNSVYFDRLFLRKYMPAANEYIHYRIIDVSSIKELLRRWKPEVHRRAPLKTLQHRALYDIRESIEELNFYKQQFFKLENEEKI